MLILASASPRRQELLANAGIVFAVQPANVPEELKPGESPEFCVRRLAREKAAAIAAQTRSNHPILAADTEVALNLNVGEPLGKPRNQEDAVRLLRMLGGRRHFVVTGVCLMCRTGTGEWRSHDAAETTTVYMQDLTEREIRDYVATGEPMDKAGAYAIQGIASRWITRIEGCYFNVVGLPVPLVCRMLRQYASEALAHNAK